MRRRTLQAAISGIALSALAICPALAAGPTYIVKGGQANAHSTAPAPTPTPEPEAHATPLDHPERGAVHIVRHPVVAPAATVSRGLRQQPTYPGLIEVQVDTQTVLIDPYKNYQHEPWGTIDENHWIHKAQRQADVHRPLPQATIVHGEGAAKTEPATTKPIPKAIIPVPERFRRPKDAEPKRTGPDQAEPMLEPQVENPRLMARSKD